MSTNIPTPPEDLRDAAAVAEYGDALDMAAVAAAVEVVDALTVWTELRARKVALNLVRQTDSTADFGEIIGAMVREADEVVAEAQGFVLEAFDRAEGIVLGQRG